MLLEEYLSPKKFNEQQLQMVLESHVISKDQRFVSDNEWLVCNTLGIVFVSPSTPQKTHQFSFGDKKMKKGERE